MIARVLIPLCIALSASCGRTLAAERPNIVMFVLDDLNDWVGPLGYRQAITPNMDRLAANGITFTNAHTAGVFCAPSRSAFFTGRHASSTGCYTTQVYHHDRPEIRPLQQVLRDGGYATFGAGKLFHHPAGYVDLRGWNEFFVRHENQKQRGWPLDSWTTDMAILPDPYPASVFNRGSKPADGFFLEWGPLPDADEDKMADTIRTGWACEVVKRKHPKPFFAAVGLYAPHFPNYAPKKYFDLYDPDKIVPPPCNERDLEDLPPGIRKAKEARAAHHRKLERLGAVKDAIHGYLACISYADAMLGRLLEAIQSGPNANHTIVILWSDHGYHHGEKFDWGKHTLWERTSNVPLIIGGSGIAKGTKVDATVSLIDLFPTITGLAGAKDDQPRDGISLLPVLKEPATARDREILLPGMKPEEFAIINRDWRYIRHADGGEELYDLNKDPNEWENLAGKPKHRPLMDKMRQKAPKTFAMPGPQAGELKLVTKGQDFHWESKPKKKAKSD
ncbi:MAG: sulfatase [Luteolibacter sp.]